MDKRPIDSVVLNKIDFVEYFNPHSKSHIQAYNTLLYTGSWPVDSIPNYVEFKPRWQHAITVKMADAWIEHKLHCNDMLDIMNK
jgi:hypothetical protein